jgi:hypothetical protein
LSGAEEGENKIGGAYKNDPENYSQENVLQFNTGYPGFRSQPFEQAGEDNKSHPEE